MAAPVAILIRQGRKRLGLTQAEFGARCGGASRAAVSLWEKGRTVPDRDRAFLIAQLLEVDVSRLLSDSDARFVTRLGDDVEDRDDGPRVPVYRTVGLAQGRADFLMTEEIVNQLGVPHRLSHQTGLRWLHVASNRMEPRYYPGELILLSNVRQADVGDHLVIVLKGGGTEGRPVMLRRLLERRNQIVKLQQYNPAKTSTFDLAQADETLRVVPTAEQIGA